MDRINADTIPGTVALPTWVMVSCIVVLFGLVMYQSYQRDKDKEKAITARENDTARVLTAVAAAVTAMNELREVVKDAIRKELR